MAEKRTFVALSIRTGLGRELAAEEGCGEDDSRDGDCPYLYSYPRGPSLSEKTSSFRSPSADTQTRNTSAPEFVS
jgi:hypothetical protein